jgi:CHAT domain-containing protein
MLLAAGFVPPGRAAAGAPADAAQRERLEEQARTHDNLSSQLRARGDYPAAEKHVREAVAILRKLYPPDRHPEGHTRLALCLNRWGLLRHEQGDIPGGETHLREAVAMFRKLYPTARYRNGHPYLAASLMNLAMVLRDREEYTEAEALLREALAMRRRFFVLDHPLVAQSLSQLGRLLLMRGDFTAAEDHFREALAMRRRLYPPKRFADGHPDLAESLSTLGSLLQERGDLIEAEQPLRDTLAILRKAYPVERYRAGHPDLAASLARLGNLLNKLGDLTGAETHLREAVAMHRTLYPPERYRAGYPTLALSLGDLGATLQARGESAEAEKLLREALAMWRKLYPKDRYPTGHEKLAEALNSIASVLLTQGDYTAADECLREAAQMWERLYPPQRYPDGHPRLALALGNLSRVFHERGDLVSAERYGLRALALFRTFHPPARHPNGHPLLATCLNNVGVILQERSDLPQADALQREALAMRRKLYPPDRYPNGHPNLAVVLMNVAGLCRERGRDEEAGAHLLEAERICRKFYPADRYPNGHPELASCLFRLGTLLEWKGDLDGAERMLREALAMRRRFYPPERHPDGHRKVASCLNALGSLYRDRGEYARAAVRLREALAMWRKLYPPELYPSGHPALAVGLLNLGLLHHERGDRAGAEPLLREAVDVQQRCLNAFLGGASETEGLLMLAALPLPVDAYLSATTRPGAGEADAYAAVWTSRAALARSLQARRQALLLAREPATRDLAREWAASRQALAQLLLAPATSGPDRAKRVSILAARKDELEKELAERLPAFRALRESTRRTPAELVQHLPEGAAFIDLLRYVRFEQDPNVRGRPGQRHTRCYVAFVLARGRPIRRVELGPAKGIDAAVAAWRQDLVAARTDSPAASLLREKVWKPLEEALPAGTRAVLLAPDGELTRLPWAALTGRTRGSVLLEEYAFAVTPYGQFLLDGLLASRADARRGGGLLAVGDVAFGRAPARVQVAEAGKGLSRAAPAAGARGPWQALPGTARELERLAGLAGPRPVTVLRGADACTARLLADLPRARWAHIATHGFFADRDVRSVLRLDEKDYERGQRGERVGLGARHPLVLSGLVLAGANRPAKDSEQDDRGILTAEAIAGLDLDGLELAVLSACETGLGEVAGGEGVFGLQRAFHAGGARSVVASLWKVDDNATQELMALFYENLWHKKLPKLEALRQAQLAILRGRVVAQGAARAPDLQGISDAQGRRTAYAAPHLWAAWVLSGDPGDLSAIRPIPGSESASPTVGEAPAAPTRLYLAVGGIVGGLALAAGWWILRRRPRT